MNISNTKNIDDFIRGISQIMLETLKTKQNESERFFDGIVTAVTDDGIRASVDIGETTFDDLLNKTGEDLTTGDTVRIYTTTITNSDAFIGVKLN